jgi:type IV secretory pathway TrbD component
MLAVVSAGADPLVRPYYEADPPQIAGMVSGLRGAAQYEKQAGLPGAAGERWDVFGSGLLAAAVIILVGNLINIGMGLNLMHVKPVSVVHEGLRGWSWPT